MPVRTGGKRGGLIRVPPHGGEQQFSFFTWGNFMNQKAMPGRNGSRLMTALALAAAGVLLLSGAARADSGPYLGASIGSATVAADLDPDFGVGNFDESDFGYKIHGGYLFDLAVLDLGVEAAYVDLGTPSFSVLGDSVTIDVTGLSLFGLAGIDLGPVGVFAKAGLINWDAALSVRGLGEVASDDGSDPAYGVGARFVLGSLEIRGEYEYFDLDGTDDVYMLSAGLVWRF